MFSGFTQHCLKELGCTVGHLRLLNKVIGAIDPHIQFQNLGHIV